jgi:predicted AlkP superfamily pyrophosphatase or phosphodiesterase
MRNPLRIAIGVLFVLAGALISYQAYNAAKQPAQASSADGKHPKLVVLVVFDQMRGDYPKKWQPLFGEGGFKRLQKDGAWFTNCHYPYAYTLTAAGHTSLVTGTTPSKHGIIANEWVDRSVGESVASTTPPPSEVTKGGGPYRRKSETVGDVLLRVLTGKSRVASLSIKERAAVLMAALRANLCYWFSERGNFVTSAYYRPDPHSWATKFNKARSADQWLDKEWDRFKPDLDYAKQSGPDDFPMEGTGYLQGRVFPHKFQYGKTKDPKANIQNYYDAVTCSPMGNELLISFAKTAIEAEKLGQGDSVDLLCLSFSSNDLIGHTWGPDSQEVLDVTLRSDAMIKDFLNYLDEKVGKDNYYFAVAADHGVCPLPEVAAEQGFKAGRVEPEILTTRAEEFLNAKYLPEGLKAPWLILPKRGNAWVYFNYATLDELKLKRTDVEKALADWFNTLPGIERAFTRTEMMTEESKEQTELFQQVQRSFHPDCSGDVMVILKPYHIFSPPNLSKNPAKNPTYRATHGMPHPYDTHVPLLIMGPRIEPGERDAKVAPQVMASILAEALGVPPPQDANYRLPDGLFKK